MDLNFKHMDAHGANRCNWCETPLSWINYAITSVCSHCYDLMANCGMAEAEIAIETDLLDVNTSDG